MRSYAPLVRELLRAAPDGLTIRQIADASGIAEDTLRKTLSAMPDKYIDRWEGPRRGQYAAVFCVVVPPPDCPHPTEQGEEL